MFIDVEIADCVRIPAACLHDDISAPVVMALQEKFGNRVLRDQGLCIGVRHISKMDGPCLYAGDSGAFVRVQFSLVLFRPFLYEVLVGRVRHSDASGVLVSFGFTEDVFIAKDQLPDPSVFDEEEQLWYWKYLDNQMYVDIGEEIRFRVLEVQYGDRSGAQAQAPDAAKPITLMADLRPAMRVLGSIAEDGLGLVKWWQQQDDDDDDDDDKEEEDDHIMAD